MLRLICAVASSAAVIMLTAVPSYIGILLGSGLYITTGGWAWIDLLSKTFKRDMAYAGHFFTVMKKMGVIILQRKTLSDLLYANVRKYSNKSAFVDADTERTLTFKQVEDMSHEIANAFYEAGYRKGDCVALLMENRVEYMPIFFGLSMIGIPVSLININLKGESLINCINVCNCKAVIFSSELTKSLKEIQHEVNVELYSFDRCDDSEDFCKDLNVLMKTNSTAPPPKCSLTDLSEIVLYMYTSGTTGLPKAVYWSRLKVFAQTVDMLGTGVTSHDTLYQSLPLYHANGVIMSLCFFFNGGTTVVKKKFSARQYIKDCCKHKVTAINYIGETCRYILSQPKSSFDNMLSIRVAVGNGLRPSIWQEFQDRFNIERVIEIYSATESNFIFFNLEGKVGAIGYTSFWFPFLSFNVKLIKVDPETDEILRDESGLAIEAGVGEPGQAVGRITKMSKFDGYTNEEATRKKIGHDIFRLGDSAYLSGDILLRDAEGYLFFQDRLGDTFRWKAENVSTNEVEGLMSKVLKLTDVCVYGVEVPGNEGKAGMACIMDPDQITDVDGLPQALDEILPRYAQPQFLRLSTKPIEVTGTFKLKKSKLRKESYNPALCGEEDLLYYFDKQAKEYRKINKNIYEEISNQTVTF